MKTDETKKLEAIKTALEIAKEFETDCKCSTCIVAQAIINFINGTTAGISR